MRITHRRYCSQTVTVTEEIVASNHQRGRGIAVEFSHSRGNNRQYRDTTEFTIAMSLLPTALATKVIKSVASVRLFPLSLFNRLVDYLHVRG